MTSDIKTIDQSNGHGAASVARDIFGFFGRSPAWPLLIALIIIFAIGSPRFLTPFNISSVLNQAVLIGILGFGATSLLCGLAPEGDGATAWLITARALQGVACAVMFPAAIGIVVALSPAYGRVAHGVMRQTKTTTYVEAARVLGASRLRIHRKHVLPNSLDLVIVQSAFDIGGVSLILAGLSFVGVGAQPPSANWGAMASGGRGYVTSAWWAALAPGLMITITVIVFALLGDMLQVRRDPTLRTGS